MEISFNDTRHSRLKIKQRLFPIAVREASTNVPHGRGRR